MKSKTSLFLIVFVFIVLGLNAHEKGPIAISPGSDMGIAVVGESCPTFSWTAMEWATGYRLEVFETTTIEVFSYEDLAARAYPVLSKEIQGRALSWTPSTDERLRNGSMYVWYVQAMDAYGTVVWSEGKLFRVDVVLSLIGMEETLREKLREAGVSEEAINEVLDDINSEIKEVNLSGGYNTTDQIRIQGNEIGTNTWYGEGAGASVPSGTGNSFFGYRAGYNHTEGYRNTFVGYQAGYSNTTGGNTFIGANAGYTNNEGNANTFIGNNAGTSNTTGFENTFVGAIAGQENTEGSYNTFMGHIAGASNTTGDFNTFVGNEAGYKTNGSRNTIIGYAAGWNNETGEGNVFLGYDTGVNELGSNKLYIDNSNTSSPLIYGEFDNDLLAINGKLGVGTKSPDSLLEIVNPSGRSDLVLNRNDGATFAFEAKLNNVRFGSLTAHALKLIVGGDPKMTINGDGSLEMISGATCTAAGVWTDASSRAYKENIEDLSVNEAKDTLSALHPVRYNYKKDKEEEYLGFIAEEVPELVASKDRKGMSPMDVVAVLTKVVQEQQDTIAELQERIAKLEKTSQ